MPRQKKIKPWKKFYLGRRSGFKGEPKKRILIVCEGEKTEPNYFKAFRVTSAVVRIEGHGQNTKKLVESAINLKNKAIQDGDPYDQIWCVFDRDSFSKKDFNDALKLVEDNDLEVAYSNEAFEIWYLLHFHYFHTGISRKDYEAKLTECLGKQYKKNSETMYEDLLENQEQAISNAKKLLQEYPNHDPERDNPSTTIFRLVEELNKNL